MKYRYLKKKKIFSNSAYSYLFFIKLELIVKFCWLSRSPLNEDVFAARNKEASSVEKEIRELQGQIYKLLLQVKMMKISKHWLAF